jgi:hypothetical protein
MERGQWERRGERIVAGCSCVPRGVRSGPMPASLPPAPAEFAWPAPGTVEAIRVGGDVYLRQPALPWPALSVAHRRDGAWVRVEAQVVAGSPPPSILWVDIPAFVACEGRWEVRGAVAQPGGGGTIGWMKSLTLEADGTAVESGYPPMEVRTRWRVDPSGAHAELDRSYGPVPIVGLARPAMTYPPLGPLRETELLVFAVPKDLARGPSPALRARTDRDGVAWVEVPDDAVSLSVSLGGMSGCEIKL